jgi:hypothetical protein
MPRLMARRANVYMKVKHGKKKKACVLRCFGAYVATGFRDTGLVRFTKASG